MHMEQIPDLKMFTHILTRQPRRACYLMLAFVPCLRCNKVYLFCRLYIILRIMKNQTRMQTFLILSNLRLTLLRWSVL